MNREKGLVIDRNAIVNYYASDFGKPIADYIIEVLTFGIYHHTSTPIK